LSNLPVALVTLISDIVTIITHGLPFSCPLILSATLVVMFGTQDVAARAILVVGGAGALVRRVLAVGAAVRAIGAMASLVTFLMTVVTDDNTRGWVRGWVAWSSDHCYRGDHRHFRNILHEDGQ